MNWIKSTSELVTALRELAADANRKQKTGSRFKNTKQAYYESIGVTCGQKTGSSYL